MAYWFSWGEKDWTLPQEEIPRLLGSDNRRGNLPFLESLGQAAGMPLLPYGQSPQIVYPEPDWPPLLFPMAKSQAQAGTGQAVGQPSGGVMAWAPIIREASQRTGVPEAVIAAVMAIESGGRPDAVSPAGAVGLMQVMPVYHAHRAQKYGGPLTDPRVNVLVGAEILKENYDRIKARNPNLSDLDAWTMAAAAYFGAFDWKNLRITDARDAVGTSGSQYAALFRQNLAVYQQAFAQPSGQSLGTPLGTPVSVAAVTGGRSFPLTQGYGATEFARTSGFYRNNFHPGIDLGVPVGTPVTAPLNGRVIYAGDAGDGYGIKVVVQLDNGYRILIGHLSQVNVRPGQVVTVGTVLGLSGNTGVSTGPHVHLGVIDPQGNYVDPRVLFRY